MSTIDWSAFTRRIYIDTELQRVYDAWTFPKQMEVWFLEKVVNKTAEGEPKDNSKPYSAGDIYTWKWNTWEHLHEGHIIEANGKDFFSFLFTGEEGVVDVKMNSSGGLIEVALTHKGIPGDEKSKMDIYNGCSLGWSFWLVNLKAWLEHGITLNDKSIERGGDHTIVNV